MKTTKTKTTKTTKTAKTAKPKTVAQKTAPKTKRLDWGNVVEKTPATKPTKTTKTPPAPTTDSAPAIDWMARAQKIKAAREANIKKGLGTVRQQRAAAKAPKTLKTLTPAAIGGMLDDFQRVVTRSAKASADDAPFRKRTTPSPRPPARRA